MSCACSETIWTATTPIYLPQGSVFYRFLKIPGLEVQGVQEERLKTLSSTLQLVQPSLWFCYAFFTSSFKAIPVKHFLNTIYVPEHKKMFIHTTTTCTYNQFFLQQTERTKHCNTHKPYPYYQLLFQNISNS